MKCNTKVIIEEKKGISVAKEVDVVVVGGGPAGISAAIASARNGARTLLIERYGFLGGNAALGLPFLGFHTINQRQIVKGIPGELVERLIEENASLGYTFDSPEAKYRNGSVVIYDVEKFKQIAYEMMLESKVELLLHTLAVDVIKESNIAKGVIIESKSGREAILSKVVIDTTGDGDIAFRAGAPYEKGRSKDRLLQPPTLLFRLGDVDVDRFMKTIRENPDRYLKYPMPIFDEYVSEDYEKGKEFTVSGLEKICQEAKEKGDYNVPNPYVLLTFLPKKGGVVVNMAKTKLVDGTNNESLTQGEIETHCNVWKVINFLQKYLPGFEEAYLISTAHQIGVRETRRIMGEYVLTEEDMTGRKKFEDRIAMGGRYLDIHDPTPDESAKVVYVIFPDGYYIPYRCLLPKRVENLLVAGRCISVSYKAQGSTRVMATCMATGQAAGTAAALAVKENISPRKIGVIKLQDKLREKGAIVD